MVTIAVNACRCEIAFKAAASRRKRLWGSASLGILLLGISGCGSLEPIAEPEVSDLELTVDTLKSSLRDAQRTITELRAEADTQRQELADVQIARAQLEGHVREAERRLIEARHVIDLQREELAGSRAARERVGRTGVMLQNQGKHQHKQASRIGEQVKGAASQSTMVPSLGGQLLVTPERVEQESLSTSDGAEREGDISFPALHVPGASLGDEVLVLSRPSPRNFLTRVLIKPGDTLWDIGRRFHIPVERLMAINALDTDHIRVGQILWLTESSTDESERERM